MRSWVANVGLIWDEEKARLRSLGRRRGIIPPTLALLPLANLILSPPPTFLCTHPLKLPLANSSWAL